MERPWSYQQPSCARPLLTLEVRSRLAALLVLWFASLHGCTFTADHKTMTNVHVEVDLYSGRENPSWDLREAEAQELRTRLATLSPDTEGRRPAPDGLGYRGIHVTVDSGEAGQRIAVAAGVVTIETASEHRVLRDHDRALEKWLLSTGKEQLGTALLQYLLGE
jgi:hypothetical protein